MKFTFRRMGSIPITLMGFIFALSSDTVAFSFRLAPDDIMTDVPTAHFHDTQDVPTPQFFRLIIKQNTLTWVLEKPYDHPSIPATRLREIPVHTPQPASSPPQPSSDQRFELSGIEIFLLRNTQKLVDQTNP